MKFRLIKNLIKGSKEKPLQAKNRISLPVVAPIRFIALFLILLGIFSVSMVIITIRDSLVNKKIDQMLNSFYEFTAQHGLNIDDIIIEGREKTTKDELSAKINLQRENNILSIDLNDIKSKLEELPWVKAVDVKRTYFPNILQIKLYEKEVLALWQNDNKFYPVDMNGKIINAEYVAHKPILVITGENAPEHINELLKITSSDSQLQKRIVAAVFFSNRRWNIIFDDFETGITVKLPQEDVEQAWEKFVKINNQYGVLNRKLTFVDLRYKDKVSVALSNTNEVN